MTRFYEDGRPRLDNNGSEREICRVAVAGEVSLFVGSDDCALSAGNLLTLIASARRHGLDPKTYIRDLFRVLTHWPRERFLEVCRRDWRVTRALTVPPSSTAEQSASS